LADLLAIDSSFCHDRNSRLRRSRSYRAQVEISALGIGSLPLGDRRHPTKPHQRIQSAGF